MAHAWKACWVQALGGSNPPSSAIDRKTVEKSTVFRFFCCGLAHGPGDALRGFGEVVAVGFTEGVYIKLQIFGVGGVGWSGWGDFCSFMYRGCKLRKVDLPGWVRVDLLGWVWVGLLGWARQYGRSESGKALRF